jgi:hypothetical protein
VKRETVSVHQASNRSPGERRDIRNFLESPEAAFVTSSWNAFYIAQRGPGHGIAVRYGDELDLAFAAGAIIDQNRGPVPHVQRLLFDDDLRSAHPARGKYGS